MIERIPPHNDDAEKGVLGSMMLDPECCDDVAAIIRDREDFYCFAHQVIYGHMIAMHVEGKAIDATLLAERLNASGDMESIGGTDYLIAIVESVPTAANAAHYARIVRDKAATRAVIHAGTELVREGYAEATDAGQLLSQAESRLMGLLDRSTRAIEHPVADVLLAALDRIDQRCKGGGPCDVTTGIESIDGLTSLAGGELVILAARTSMGKTAFALNNLAVKLALDDRRHVLLFSLEMPKLELADRLLCSRASVNQYKARRGHLDQDERRRLVLATNELSQANLSICDECGIGVSQIAAIARRAKRRKALDLVIVDYLQLVEPDNTRDIREQQVAVISRRLKRLAIELSIPVVVLAQLNRLAEATPETRPKLHHLRESGAIEQDADQVWMLWRADRERNSDDAELILAKHRNGSTGVAKLTWQGEHVRFVTRDYTFR